MDWMPDDHSPDLKSEKKVIELVNDLKNCWPSHVSELLVLESKNEGGHKIPDFSLQSFTRTLALRWDSTHVLRELCQQSNRKIIKSKLLVQKKFLVLISRILIESVKFTFNSLMSLDKKSVKYSALAGLLKLETQCRLCYYGLTFDIALTCYLTHAFVVHESKSCF